MNYLRDQGVDPNDEYQAEYVVTDADRVYMRFIDEQANRIANMTTDAIFAERNSIGPDFGRGWDDVHDLLTAELRKRGALSADPDPLF